MFEILLLAAFVGLFACGWFAKDMVTDLYDDDIEWLKKYVRDPILGIAIVAVSFATVLMGHSMLDIKMGEDVLPDAAQHLEVELTLSGGELKRAPLEKMEYIGSRHRITLIERAESVRFFNSVTGKEIPKELYGVGHGGGILSIDLYTAELPTYMYEGRLRTDEERFSNRW